MRAPEVLKLKRPTGRPNWDCRCGSDECWECMHLLYAAYDEAYATDAAIKANAPVCTESKCLGSYTERHMCSCGNWFCNHCGFHVESDINKITGNICWAGAA
jgi:hypothetical protein